MATFLIAGHETTAVTLAWTFHLLGQHPEIRERLQNEVDRVLGGRLQGPEDLPQLALTSRVIDKALRLYPRPGPPVVKPSPTTKWTVIDSEEGERDAQPIIEEGAAPRPEAVIRADRL